MRSFSKKKIIIMSIIILGVIAIGVGSYKLFFDDINLNEKIQENEEVQENVDETTIILSINPKIALVIDKNGNVVSIYPLNEDAKIFNKEDFEGIKIEKAVEKVVEVAENYLEEKPEVTISFEDEEKQEDINIKSIESLFNSKGIKTKKLKLDDKESKEIKEKIKEEKENRKKENKTTTTTTTSITSTTTKTTTKKNTNKTTKKATTTTTSKIKSNNSYLKTLNITNTKINFTKDIYSYETVVSYNVSSVNINAVSENNYASVIGVGKKNLTVGENNFTIKVIAEDGSAKEYNIKITRRALVNLNENKTYTYLMGTLTDVYIYPNNPDCIGKFPEDIDVPEGDTYDNYCKNTPPTSYPKVEGLGYYCNLIKTDTNNGTTTSDFYECHSIREIYNEKEMQSKAYKAVKYGNYFAIAGGYGNGPEKIILNEEKCEKFNIPCGRW